MHVVLDGMSAFEFWMSVVERPISITGFGANPPLTSFEGTSSHEISGMIERQGGSNGKLHLLVERPEDRRSSKWVVCHCAGNRGLLPAGSILQVGSGIYVVSPEYCALRLATQLPRFEFLRAFTDLLGIYSLSVTNRTDIIRRRQAIMTKQTMGEFLSQAAGLPGTLIARKSLQWVVERSASPRETSACLALGLPTRLGGQAMLPFESNLRIDLSEGAQRIAHRRYVEVDIAWNGGRLVLEYNSDEFHDSEKQMAFDFDKIAAMQHEGNTVVPLSTQNFNSYDTFASIVSGIRKQLRIRDRRAARADARRASTHEELLRIEREQRRRPSLLDTSRWMALLPRIDDDCFYGCL